MEARPSGKTSRLGGIEGVRAIAALGVLVYHVWIYGAPDARPVELGVLTKPVENLRAGVTLFFILSGFLLYRVFVAAALRGQPMPSVRSYLRNRALRILPAYWAILIAVTLVFEPELLTMPLMFVANFLLLQNYVPAYAAGGEEGLGIVPTWSLVIEVSFYVLVPLLGYTAVRLAAPHRRLAAALVPVGLMLAAGIAAKAIARAMEPSGALTVWNFSLPVYADWFAAGMAVAVARVLHEDGRLVLWRRWVVVGVVGAAALAALAAKLYYADVLSGHEQQTANAIFFAFALGFVVLSTPESRVVRGLSRRPVVFLGLASYSVFLVHDPLVRGLREWGLTSAGTGGFVANLALVGGLSVLAASASYRYVERPALARKRSWHVGDRAGLGSTAPAGAESPPSTVALADVLSRVVKESASANDGTIDVTLEGTADLLVRPDVVAKVVAPLLDNAVTYGRTPVKVTARKKSREVFVTVEDSGRGIDDAFVPLLFEAHARSERSAAEAAGRGLGLSRARMTARANGGDVRYEPNRGGGARFVASFSDVSAQARSARGGLPRLNGAFASIWRRVASALHVRRVETGRRRSYV